MTDCWEYDHSGCPYKNIADCPRIDVCFYPIKVCPIEALNKSNPTKGER